MLAFSRPFMKCSVMERVVHAALAFVAVASTATAGQHPNVLLLMVDDLRPSLGCYGDSTAITPSIDALARIGVTFTKAFAQQTLCGPSRTSLLTSRRPSSTGVVDVHRYWRQHGNYSTLPQHFRQHGYYTASAGKIFHPGICSNFTDDAPYSWSGIPFHPSTQAYKNAPACGPHKNATDIVCPVALKEQPEQTLPDLQTAHYAISFLHRWKQVQRGGGAPPVEQCSGQDCPQPFFLAVGFHKPHIPLKYPKGFLDLYPLSRIPLPPNRRLPSRLPPVAFNPWNDLRWRHDIASLNLTFPYQAMPDDYARRIIQSYYAATSYTDLLIGDLLTVTERLFPDTVVALLGDHGWSLGEHQEWSKFSNYEVATRVPLIFAGIRGYEKARRRLLGSRKNVRKNTRGTNRNVRVNTSSSSNGACCGNNGSNKGNTCTNGRGSNNRCNEIIIKKKTSANPAADRNNTNNKSNGHHLNPKSRRNIGKHVSRHKRKQFKLYLQIQKRLGRHFRRWRGRANKHNLDYEKYWRFSEMVKHPKGEADSVKESTGSTFSRYGRHSPKYGRARPRDGRSRPRDGRSRPRDGRSRPRDGRSRPRDGRSRPRDGRSRPKENRFPRWSAEHLPIKRNVTYDGIVELVDLFPTLADLAGIQKVPTCQSKSGFTKLDRRNKTLPFDVGKEKVKVELCTEGQSLSSIIIDNNVMKMAANPYDRLHSHQKDNQNSIESSNHRRESEKVTSPSNPDLTLLAPHKRSSNISADSVSFVDSVQLSSTLTHSLNHRSREMLPDNSHSNIKIPSKISEARRMASKRRRPAHLLSTSYIKPPLPRHFSELSNRRCSASLTVGRVGLSQYPRPSLNPSQDPDSDQPRLTETIVMGYSMRSLCYRYTLWVAFNSTAFLPDFDTVHGVELYDHRTDPGENKNVVWSQRKVARSADKRLKAELKL